MTRRRQLLQAGALGTAATFTTSLYAQTRPTVRWRMAALYPRSLDTCYGATEQMCKCRRRSKSEPPCRPNIEPGVGAGLQRAGGG